MLGKFVDMEQITDMQAHITATQCRMARGALGWSTRDLAKASKVGATTIQRFENGYAANPSTLAWLRQTFEVKGLMFIPGDETAGAGIRWKKSEAGKSDQ